MSVCPICQKPTVQKYRPFCCKRCADVDLARWLRGEYRIPGDLIYEEEFGVKEATGKLDA